MVKGGGMFGTTAGQQQNLVEFGGFGMASVQTQINKNSKLIDGGSLAEGTVMQKVKEEVISPPRSPSRSKDTENGVDKTASTPKRIPSREDTDAPVSPPIFSMDALTDVLGDLMGGDGSQDGHGSNDIEQKFCLDDISTIEQNADSVATALFNATQTSQKGSKPRGLQAEYSFQKQGKRKISGATDLLGDHASYSSVHDPPLGSTTTSSLPQLEHPLLETLLSPATSSRCTSPIYSLVQECLDKKNRDDGNDGSSDSNVGSECCSDSDFELEADSSPTSDNSSDSDFNLDDSDSDYENKRKRNNGPKKPHHKRQGFKLFGATRKQPYYHHKSTKSKEQVALLMGDNKPLAHRQISTHQLEAIAATMGSSPVTVSWLLQNYETSEGNSLPRALMYGHYLRHCAELRLDPVNAASFGKLIRSVFVGLTTRRLGTRGNSKYHYCGIRIKDSSMLLLEDPDLSKKTRTNGKRSKKTQILAMQGVGICGLGGNKGLTLELDSGGKIDFNSVKKYLGTRTSTFPEISVSELYVLDGVTGHDLTCFINIYEQHCLEILEAAEKFNLNDLEKIWERFYQFGGDNGTLAKETLLLLTQNAEVQFSIENIDAYTYDQLLSILMPNVIAQLPYQLLEEYHKFILNLRMWLTRALHSYDTSFVQQKFMLLDAFINEFKAWISLNLSAQAARDSMQSPNSIAQLLSDLNRINFRSVLMDVKEYVNVDEMDINVHESLKRILSGPDSIEPWSIWLVGLVEQRLGKSRTINDAEDGDSTFNAIIQECRDLSLRWLKYMSQLKLELLLRSSGSLATFLSLELLFSNFLLHLIKVYKSRALAIPLVMYNMARKANMSSTKENGDSSYNGEVASAQVNEEADARGKDSSEGNQNIGDKITSPNTTTANIVGEVNSLEAEAEMGVVKEEIFDEDEIRAMELNE